MSIAQGLPTAETLHDGRRGLRAQLARVRRRLRLELGLEVLAEVAVALAVGAAILILLDWSLRLGRSARVVLLIATLGAIAPVLGVRAWRRWRGARLDDLSLAVIIDRFRPGTGQRVADVLQLPDLLDQGEAEVSPALIRLAVRNASEALAGSNWPMLWNRKRTAGFATALGLGLLAPVAFAAIAPESARLSVARWLLGSAERWPQTTYLTVMGLDRDGRLLAPRDEPIALEVRSDLPMVERSGAGWLVRGRGEPLAIRRKPAGPVAPDPVLVRERTAEGDRREAPMAVVGPGRYRFDLPASRASSTFELTGGDDWLGPIAVERVDRPALAGVRLRVKEPGAASGEFREIDDPRQHHLFLPDTEVELTLSGTEPVAEAQLKVNPGSPPGLGRIDDRTFSARWALREATTLEIVLRSVRTGLESRPAFLSIGLLRDREPRVTVRAQGVGARVTPVATVPLAIGATDDLGLAALRLQVDRTPPASQAEGQDPDSGERAESRPTRSTVVLPLASAGDRPVLDQQVRHDLILQADPPPPGTLIRIVGEADDHYARGAQVGRSSVLALQVVTADELFYEILIRQRAERAKFLAILESHEKQAPMLEGAEPPDAEDWARMARLEHATARQLDQIAGRLADTLQEMKLNQVGSAKSHRLLQDEVIDPIRALGPGPLNALRDAVQGLANAGQGSAETVESARRLHGEVVTTLKNILARMSQWESFVDVVNQVAEVIRMEQRVLQETEKARESRTTEVFDGKP